MIRRWLGITAVAAALFTRAAMAQTAPASSAADVSQRIEQLQAQIEALQSEVAALKKQVTPSTSNPSPASSAAVQAANPAPAAAPASPPAAPTLASLMGSTTVTGFIDGYYDYNFNHPHSYYSPSAQSPITPLRAFDAPSNQFAFNMAELTIARPPDSTNSRLGYNLTFGAGNAMNVVNGTDPGGLGFAQYVKEAYLSYLAPVGKGLQVDFGKFVTPAGAEVIETKDDWNYSRSLLFFYAIPFYHFGLRAKYAFSDKYSLTGYVVNGWNNIIDNNTGKTYGASFGWSPTKKVSVTQTYLAGPEMTGLNAHWRQLSDTVVQYSPTGKLSLMANYDYGRGDMPQGFTKPVWWSGVAGYIRYAFNDNYALATRYEYYDDAQGFTTGTAQHLNEFTGTFERKIAGHLITRLEYRRDMSNRPTLLKGSTPTDTQDTAAAGLVYVFDLKEAK
jgi:hypothetical protein